MEYKDILYQIKGAVATITINRPDKHNAFTLNTLDELAHAFEAADADTNVGVVVLTGAGEKAFCSGGDVNSEADFTKHKAWLYNRRCLHLSSTIRNSGKPVIARVNGLAVGGGNELNLLCDLAIASDRAYFAQAGARVASVPIWYCTQLLPRNIGERRAKEVVFLCHRYPAEEALRLGWINRVVPHDQLDAAVEEWCKELLEKSPTALMLAKLNLNYESDQMYGSVVQGFRMLNLGLHGTDEQREGMHAFLEKRKPDFSRFRW